MQHLEKSVQALCTQRWLKRWDGSSLQGGDLRFWKPERPNLFLQSSGMVPADNDCWKSRFQISLDMCFVFLRSLELILSVPADVVIFKLSIISSIPEGDMEIGLMNQQLTSLITGTVDVSSCVNIDAKGLFITTGHSTSEMVSPSRLVKDIVFVISFVAISFQNVLRLCFRTDGRSQL